MHKVRSGTYRYKSYDNLLLLIGMMELPGAGRSMIISTTARELFTCNLITNEFALVIVWST